MNTLPLRLTLSARGCVHLLLVQLLSCIIKSWLTYKGTTGFFFACLCVAIHQVYKYKLGLIKYTGRSSTLHTDCAGIALAVHLVAAGGFLLRIRTMYSVMYATATLAMLFEFMKGTGQRQYGGSSFFIQNYLEA